MILVIDKPSGITSHTVVSKIRYALKNTGENTKVGHAGTLDPMCTGVLPVLIGKDTRILPYLPKKKAYRAKMLLGRETDTEDVTGKTVSEKSVCVTFSDVVSAAESFVGKIMQTPPMYSAVKVNGKKLYELARDGKEIDRASREVTVFSLKVSEAEEENTYILDVECSAGTYIRTLCADIGKKLGCGGCMAALRRTVSNGFEEKNAVSLDDVLVKISDGRLSEIAVLSEDIFDTKKVILPKDGEKYYLNGGKIACKRLSLKNPPDGLLRVYTSDGVFAGIGKSEEGELRPLVTYID